MLILCFIVLVQKQLPGREEQGNDFNQVSIKGCAVSFIFVLFSHQYIHMIIARSFWRMIQFIKPTWNSTVWCVFLQSFPDFVFILLVLNKCQIKDPELMYELLKATYKNLPMLPRYSNLSHNLFQFLAWPILPLLGERIVRRVALCCPMHSHYTIHLIKSQLVLFSFDSFYTG